MKEILVKLGCKIFESLPTDTLAEIFAKILTKLMSNIDDKQAAALICGAGEAFGVVGTTVAKAGKDCVITPEETTDMYKAGREAIVCTKAAIDYIKNK